MISPRVGMRVITNAEAVKSLPAHGGLIGTIIAIDSTEQIKSQPTVKVQYDGPVKYFVGETPTILTWVSYLDELNEPWQAGEDPNGKD